MIALLLATAMAAPPLVLGAGLETTLNDPYLVRQGLRLSAAVAPWPWLEIGAMGAVHPLDASSASTLRAETLRDAAGFTVAASAVRARAAVLVDVPALRIDVGDSSVAVGPSVQAGMIYTVDDADALQVAPDEPAFLATARERHIAPTVGLLGEARRGALGLRVRLDRTSYVEHQLTEISLDQDMLWAAAELTWSP